jgi:hypothetical protein
MKRRVASKTILSIFLILLASVAVAAQSNQFGYQGSLNAAGTAANGNYDFEFALFDGLIGGNQIGSVQMRNGVAVVNGVFSVKLDFGPSFPGAARFLEIRVRQSGQPGLTTLAPRQLIDSSPYAIKSLNADIAATATNATQLGGVAANQFVVTTDPRMSDPRNPLPGSASYIQNSLGQQATSNFNISGNGTAGGTLSGNTVNSATQYNLGGARVLAIPGIGDLFVGTAAGTSNTTGTHNTFFGITAGFANTSGGNNSFFGSGAGDSNTTASGNAFFGRSAGGANTASNNSFFGASAGVANTSGIENAFFGFSAGLNNVASCCNSFFGFMAGAANGAGFQNSFFGRRAGESNTTGFRNSFFGSSAGIANDTGNENSFFGHSAGLVNSSGAGNAFFGYLAGAANTTADSNAFFGHSAGAANTTGFSNAYFGRSAGAANTGGDRNSFFGRSAGEANTVGNENSFFGHSAGLVNLTGNQNAFFGRNAGAANDSGLTNSFFGFASGVANTTGDNNTFIGANSGDNNTTGNSNTAIGANASASGIGSFSTAIGAGASTSFSNRVQLGRQNMDTVAIGTPGNPGTFHVCFAGTGGNVLSDCSSSRRYKENIQSLNSGLDLISRLRPVTFNWKAGGMADLGLIAEEVAEVEPLMVSHNAKGIIEGVKYDQIAVVLINAVNELQAQIQSQKDENARQKEIIEHQQSEYERQRKEFDALKKLVCSQNPSAEVCKPVN